GGGHQQRPDLLIVTASGNRALPRFVDQNAEPSIRLSSDIPYLGSAKVAESHGSQSTREVQARCDFSRKETDCQKRHGRHRPQELDLPAAGKVLPPGFCFRSSPFRSRHVVRQRSFEILATATQESRRWRNSHLVQRFVQRLLAGQ